MTEDPKICSKCGQIDDIGATAIGDLINEEIEARGGWSPQIEQGLYAAFGISRGFWRRLYQQGHPND